MSELINTKELARRYGMSERYWAKLRVTGGGPPYRRLGRRALYAPLEVDSWVSERRFRSTSEELNAARTPTSRPKTL